MKRFRMRNRAHSAPTSTQLRLTSLRTGSIVPCMSSILYRLNKKIDSLLNESQAYWKQHETAWRVLLCLIVGVSLFVAALPLILKIAGISTLYFLILAVAQFILAILITRLAITPPPKIFNILRKFISSSIAKAVSFLPSTPYTPPRSRDTV